MFDVDVDVDVGVSVLISANPICNHCSVQPEPLFFTARQNPRQPSHTLLHSAISTLKRRHATQTQTDLTRACANVHTAMSHCPVSAMLRSITSIATKFELGSTWLGRAGPWLSRCRASREVGMSLCLSPGWADERKRSLKVSTSFALQIN